MTMTDQRRSGLMGNTDPDWAPALRMGPKHTTAGQWLGGRIVAFGESQEVKNGQPQVFPSGDPIMCVWVNVQTDEVDPTIEGDDGVRRMFIDGIDRRKEKFGSETYMSKKRAARKAVIDAKAGDLDVDGELWLRWTDQRDTGAPSLATNWEAVYRRPSQATGQPPEGGTKPATKKAAPARTRPTVVRPAQDDDQPPF